MCGGEQLIATPLGLVVMCTGMATVRRMNGTDISVTDWNGDGTETERYGRIRYGRR